MSPRLRAALYAQAGAVFSLHPCLYAGDRPTAGRSRFATLLPGDAAVSPSNGDHAGTQRADPPPPRNGPKHRGAGRSRSATGPPRQSRSTRQFFCAEVLVSIWINTRDHCPPHVHCGDKARNWEGRVTFTFVNNITTFWDCLTPANDPGLGVFKEIERNLTQYVRQCRAEWWRIYS